MTEKPQYTPTPAEEAILARLPRPVAWYVRRLMLREPKPITKEQRPYYFVPIAALLIGVLLGLIFPIRLGITALAVVGSYGSILASAVLAVVVLVPASRLIKPEPVVRQLRLGAGAAILALANYAVVGTGVGATELLKQQEADIEASRVLDTMLATAPDCEHALQAVAQVAPQTPIGRALRVLSIQGLIDYSDQLGRASPQLQNIGTKNRCLSPAEFAKRVVELEQPARAALAVAKYMPWSTDYARSLKHGLLEASTLCKMQNAGVPNVDAICPLNPGSFVGGPI